MPPIVIWERLDGRHEVITGRHRLDLARRTGESTIPAQIVKEADGFTVRDAQQFDVESNIKDEKGTTKDYVRYFERRPELSEEAARNGGLLARKGINAWKIARIGSDDVRSQFLSGKISERKAVAISEGAPRSDAAQAAGLSRAGKLSAEELKAFVSIINQAVPENANKAEQGDLFGFDASYLKEQEKIASMVAKDKSFIGEKIRAVKGALRNPQAAEEMGLKFEATPENIAAEVEKLNMQSAALDRFYLNSDLMRYYRNKINGKDAGSLDDILNLSVVSESAVEPDPNQGTLFQKGVGGLSALFTDEAARATYVSETAAMFADQVLAEANFRKTSIDDVLKASDIVFEDGGIKFKIGERIVDADGNVLEQAMFPSKAESIEEFYDIVVSGKEKRPIFFQKQVGDVFFDIPSDTVRHDVNKHSITSEELSNVFYALNEGKINEAYYGDYQRYSGVPVKMSVDVNGTEYGVSFERLKNGRNILGTVFKLTDKTWLKKGEAQANPSKPDSKSRPLGHSLKDIIAKIEAENNDALNKGVFFQESFDVADENARLDDIYPEYEGETININGQEKTVYNSNGERIAKSAKALQNFYKWFGDSKVVDEQERPIVVYHNSGAPREVLSREYARTSIEIQGVFFAPQSDPYQEYGPYEHEVYLRIENPADWKTAYQEHGITLGEREDSGIKVREWLQDKGYDGVMLYEDGELYELIAFESNQIKSTSNKGTYSESENIYLQTALKSGGGVKGSYSPYKRLLKITEKADYSTLPHEFAHFWLSEMEGWVNSGLASDAYMDRYDIAMDWLGVEQGRPLTRRAQERFARGYEQYLLNGNLPENPMNPIYAEYDRWLKAVYDDMNQPSKKPLTTDMVRFFQSMTTGTLPDTVLPPVNVDREKEKEEKGKKEVISKTETTTAADVSGQTESAGVSVPVVPLAVEASAGKVSAAAERQNRLNKINGMLKEDPQNVFYDPVTLEQSAQQAEMLIERDGLDGVRQMIDGEKPMPDNVIRTAVLIAYEQEMLKQGNTEEYLRVLRKHTLEQTRRGQEISAERINQDITNPSYWAKQAILGRKNSVSDVVFERIKKDGDTKEKAVDRFVSKTAAEYAEKLAGRNPVTANISDVSTKPDIKGIRSDAKAYLKETVRKQNIVHPELGKIRISGKGIDEFFKYSADKRKLALVPRLKELIETSMVGQKEAPKHERKDGIVGFIPLYNEAIIDGQAVKTETLIGVDENGNLFYDVFLDEKRSRRKSNMETKSMPLSTASDINITLSEEKGNIDQSVIDELNGKIQSITGKQIELFQKENVAGKAYDAVYDEIGLQQNNFNCGCRLRVSKMEKDFMIEQLIIQTVGNMPFAFALYLVYSRLDRRLVILEERTKDV